MLHAFHARCLLVCVMSVCAMPCSCCALRCDPEINFQIAILQLGNESPRKDTPRANEANRIISSMKIETKPPSIDRASRTGTRCQTFSVDRNLRVHVIWLNHPRAHSKMRKSIAKQIEEAQQRTQTTVFTDFSVTNSATAINISNK